VLYAAWMTGFSFHFSECDLFPNYAMLADGFAQGHLFIHASPPADTILKDGHRYIFSGPVPALIRLPLRLLFGTSVPSGPMIVLFCAGAGTLFALILKELFPAKPADPLAFGRRIFDAVFMLNGVSLYMVTIPSIHHESISGAAFFLLLAILFLLKAHNDRYRPKTLAAIMIGLSLSLSVGCRFSYAFAAATIFGVFSFGTWKNCFRQAGMKVICSLAIAASIGAASLGLLLWYNFMRFGGLLNFGMAHMESLYQSYFQSGGYFRYDHLPYNLWSLFFRVPQIAADFPYIKLPAYILQVRSIGFNSYFLINVNELTVSIFYLLPILAFAGVPLFASKFFWEEARTKYIVLSALVAVQVAAVAFTVASVPRYYYDFIAPLMMMAFMAATRLRLKYTISNGLIAFIGGISLILSFALPINAIAFSAGFILYKSPLLRIFF